MPTDPQDDVPCRDCKRPTQHATERCDDCRTPAGRLLAELAALGLTITTDKYADPFASIGEYGVTVVMEEVGDNLSNEPMYEATITLPECFRFTEDEISAAATAIAAIVQTPALRADRNARAAEVERLRVELEKPVAGAWLMGGDVPYRPGVSGYMVAWAGVEGWMTFYASGGVRANGPENEDAGKHAADLALIAAGYRLVGGVHPLPGEGS